MKKNHYPHWTYPTFRAFRAQKRADLRAVKRAVSDLRRGCAYLPGGSEGVHEIETIVDRLIDECSVKRWGR